MGWSFRKGFRIAKGVRMTVSGSGISYSVGGKGFRLTTGSRGTYVSVGYGGIRYRQRIDAPAGPRATPPASQPISVEPGTVIPTADVGQLVDSSSAATIEALNRCMVQPTYAGFTTTASVILGLMLFGFHPLVGLAASLYLAYVVWSVRQWDRRRTTYALLYDLDPAAQQRWQKLVESVGQLSQSQVIWRVHTMDATYDWKRNAGANTVITRRPSAVAMLLPERVISNITPISIITDREGLFFFPDRIYVLTQGRFGAVDYEALILDVGTTNFVESQQLPADAAVTDSTWQYVNKSGGPDRRFSYNPELPIARYGVVQLGSTSGLNLVFQTSNAAAAANFVQALRAALVPPAPAPRPTAAPTAAARGQDPPGRWVCRQCGANNMLNASACFKCRSQRR